MLQPILKESEKKEPPGRVGTISLQGSPAEALCFASENIAKNRIVFVLWKVCFPSVMTVPVSVCWAKNPVRNEESS